MNSPGRAQPTSFQRAVVVLTAAAVILELVLSEPSLVVASRVAATVIGGGVIWWLGWNRSVGALAAAVLVGWLGVSGWTAWQGSRQQAVRACDEAQTLAQGKMNWGTGVDAVAAITAPDGGRWAVAASRRLASVRMPRGWRVETSPVPTVVVVESGPPRAPGSGDIVSVGLVDAAGWTGISGQQSLSPGAYEIFPQVTKLLRAHYPQYSDLSDREFLWRVQAKIVYVGGPTERLVSAFCSPTRLWLGGWP